ncbi:MAG: OmpH family outer membrane protein [Acidobacteriota bacterium]|nr:OmpH family outer membrane protein [Acidobacteriota bacterium]
MWKSHRGGRNTERFLISAACLLSICTGFSTVPIAAQEAPARIAVVNLDVVIAQSPAGKDLQDKLTKFQEVTQATGEAKTNAARELQQQIVNGANSLSEDRLADLQKQLEDAQIDLRRFRDDKQREGEKMQEEGLKMIEQQLEPVFTQIRDEGGYDLILNNVPGVVVMVGPRVEITGEVIERLTSATRTDGG